MIKNLYKFSPNEPSIFSSQDIQTHPEFEKSENIHVRLYLDYAEPVKKLFYLVDMQGYAPPENLEKDFTELLGARTKVTNSKINPIGRHIKLAAILKIDGVDSYSELKKRIRQGITTKPQALQNIKEKLFHPKYLNITEMKITGTHSDNSFQNQPIIELDPEVHHPHPMNPFGVFRPPLNFPQGFPLPFQMQMMRNFLPPNFPGHFGFPPNQHNRPHHNYHHPHHQQQGVRYNNYNQHHQPFHMNNYNQQHVNKLKTIK